jgi:hypothetical protein
MNGSCGSPLIGWEEADGDEGTRCVFPAVALEG